MPQSFTRSSSISTLKKPRCEPIPAPQDPHFFADLPAELLLSMRPAELEAPSWRTHIAALALVTLDPNLETSQFLQGWAMEDRFTLHDGPGVAYELLWANPYLPGVSYQNMDPWLYVPNRLLLARSDWTPQACWIRIRPDGKVPIEDSNCPPDWRENTVQFGHLTLMPMPARCVDVPAVPNSATVIVRGEPNQQLTYTESGKRTASHADSAGFWRVPAAVAGKVCASR